MRKVLAFVLAVACCVGLLTGAHRAVSALDTQVTYTETVLQGDLAWAEGETLGVTYACGTSMYWYTDYTLGAQGSYDMDFVFSQENLHNYDSSGSAYFLMYSPTSFGVGGDITINTTIGFGSLFRAVAAVTPNGGSTTMAMKVADYLDYYPMDYELRYDTGTTRCYQTASTSSGHWGGVEMYYQYDAYQFLIQNFKFPVWEDHIVDVTVTKDENGSISGIELTDLNGPTVEINGFVTDAGIYMIPVYRLTQDSASLPGGEYPQGYGVYFMPWKESEATVRYDVGSTYPEVEPDTDKLELLFELDEEAVLYHFEAAHGDTQLRMLSLEDGAYVFTVLDLKTGDMISRTELARAEDPENTWPSWCWSEELLYVEAEQQVALMTDNGGIRLEFVVPSGENGDFLSLFNTTTGSMKYEDGKLLLVNSDTWHKSDFWVCGYDATGLRLLAEFSSSLTRANERSGTYISTNEFPAVWK